SHWRKIRVQLAPQCLLLLFSFVEHSSCLCVYISIAVVLSPFSPASVSISLAVVLSPFSPGVAVYCSTAFPPSVSLTLVPASPHSSLSLSVPFSLSPLCFVFSSLLILVLAGPSLPMASLQHTYSRHLGKTRLDD